jgi:hypothetical protein
MAGLDPAIQSRAESSVVLLWMAASVGGHDVLVAWRAGCDPQ